MMSLDNPNNQTKLMWVLLSVRQTCEVPVFEGGNKTISSGSMTREL